MFDLSITKLLVLAVIAVVVFGPDQLPRVAAQAGRALRELRRLTEGARNDLREGLGPEFSDFDLTDLHPRQFVRKHLLEDFDSDLSAPAPYQAQSSDQGGTTVLAPGETPPYDAEAT